MFRSGTKRRWHEFLQAGARGMPDAARIAQAQALEVPVILQGVRAEGTAGQRELFTENATTVLVFDNGAVLNLRTRLGVGQTVFVHNTQNGKEALCKVLEAPSEAETGYTDLEFTNPVPNFWDTNPQADPQPANQEAQNSTLTNAPPESHLPTGSPTDDPLAMMLQTASKIDVPSMTKPGAEPVVPLREDLMAAHEMAPGPSAAQAHVPTFEPAATADRPSSEPTGEQIDAALKQMSGPAPAGGTERTNPDDEKHIAALMARDARLAKFAAFKEKQAEKIQRDAAAKAAAKEGATEARESEGAGPPKELPMQTSLLDRLTTGKNATYLTIAAGLLILVAVGFIWHSLRSTFEDTSETPAATAPAQPAAAPASAPATSPATLSSASAAASVPGIAPERNSAPRPRANETARGAGGDDEESRHRKAAEAGALIEPAEVLSQPEPTLPPWAKDMQVDGVVTLDATIDEKGNVVATRVLSGPRPLQREAERAIGLWVFEPARENGKAIPWHLRLSVGFLPPPPPKRFP